MPILDDSSMENIKNIGTSGYGYSAIKIENLGASEYTLVGIAADRSGSVASFCNEIEAGVKSVVEACRSSPRCDNLMLRFLTFDQRLIEVHGFKPLTDCAPDSYNGTCQAGGSTALYDACYNVIGSLRDYGRTLYAGKYTANGILFVITDGEDNASTMTPGEIKKILAEVVTEEKLESLITVLVGVNVQGHVEQALKQFAADVGFTQFVPLKDATPKTLAKLAAFVSKSISSQSQALNSGAASKLLTF